MQSIEKVEQHFLENEKDTVEVGVHRAGLQLRRHGQNTGMAFVKLKDWDERKRPETAASTRSPAARWRASARSRTRMVFAFAPPPMPELGNASGFDFYLKDNAGLGPRGAGRGAQPVARHGGAEQAARQRAPERPGRHAAVPHRHRHGKGRRARPVDRRRSTARCQRPGAGSTSTTSSTAAASSACTCRPTRRSAWSPEDFNHWYVRNDARRDGAVLGVRHLALGLRLAAPRALQRRAGVQIHGEAAPGVSSGEAMAEIEALVAKLPAGFGIEWTGVVVPGARRRARRRRCSTRCRCWSCSCASRRCTRAGRSRPRCCWWRRWASSARCSPPRCAAWSATSTSRSAMLTTVGLSSKNAILIVEFAKANLRERHGADRGDACRRCAIACARS